MSRFRRGEVWLVDLGMTAKVRPCLVLSVLPADEDRALVTLVSHTTSVRESNFASEAGEPVSLSRSEEDALSESLQEIRSGNFVDGEDLIVSLRLRSAHN